MYGQDTARSIGEMENLRIMSADNYWNVLQKMLNSRISSSIWFFAASKTQKLHFASVTTLNEKLTTFQLNIFRTNSKSFFLLFFFFSFIQSFLMNTIAGPTRTTEGGNALIKRRLNVNRIRDTLNTSREKGVEMLCNLKFLVRRSYSSSFSGQRQRNVENLIRSRRNIMYVRVSRWW